MGRQPLHLASGGGDGVRDHRRKFFGDLIPRLLWAAEHDFRRRKPTADGSTLAENFASYERQTGKRHPEDERIQIPDDGAYLLEWFYELGQGRPVCEVGYLPIPASEIAAWCALREIHLRPWELDVIRALDRLLLTELARKF